MRIRTMKKVLSILIGMLPFLASQLMAAGGVVTSPTGVAPDRYVYYPNLLYGESREPIGTEDKGFALGVRVQHLF